MQGDAEESQRMESIARTDDLEQSIHEAEHRIEQKEMQLRAKEEVQAELKAERDELKLELSMKQEEIAELERKSAQQQVSLKKE